jgi:hypothetical protein
MKESHALKKDLIKRSTLKLKKKIQTVKKERLLEKSKTFLKKIRVLIKDLPSNKQQQKGKAKQRQQSASRRWRLQGRSGAA